MLSDTAKHYNSSPSPASTLLLCGVVLSTILLAEIPGGNYINIALSGAFVATVLAATLAGQRSIWFGRELGILILWLAFAILPSFASVSVETAFFNALTMFQIIILAFCIQQALVWQQSVSILLVLYGLAVGISYGITFTEFSLAEVADADLREGGARIASTLSNENKFGAACVMGLALVLLSIARGGPKWLVPLWMLLLPILTVAAVNSGSRTALLGVVLVLLGSVWAFRMWRGVVFLKFSMLLPLFTALGIGMYYVSQTNPVISERLHEVFDTEGFVMERFMSFFDIFIDSSGIQADGSIDSRVTLIRSGVDIIGSNPIIGIGLDNFRHVSGSGTYSHSNPIEIAVSSGLVGLAIYYAIYAVICWRALVLNSRTRGHPLPRVVLLAMTGYTLMDLTHVSYDEKSSWLFLALLTATLELFSREVSERAAAVRMLPKQRYRKLSSQSSSCSNTENANEFEDIDELSDALGQSDATPETEESNTEESNTEEDIDELSEILGQSDTSPETDESNTEEDIDELSEILGQSDATPETDESNTEEDIDELSEILGQSDTSPETEESRTGKEEASTSSGSEAA